MNEDDIFLVAKPNEIKSGKTTDIYFYRTKEILEKDGLDKIEVNAEVSVSSFPKTPFKYPWVVVGGLRDVAKLFKGLKVDIDAVPEGTIIFDRDINGVRTPIMNIRGPYGEFVLYETPMLGFLAAGSGFATKAARIRKVAGDKVIILSFGARRNHPALAPFIDFYAYIGGCDGVSVVLSAEKMGKKPSGTMPHSLLIIYRFEKGDHKYGWIAFDKYMTDEVPRILLSDTFYDEVEEAIRGIEAVGPDKVWGVRFDTPGSRRGDFPAIVREAIWKLRTRGYDNVKIFVSGGLNEDTIPELVKAGAVGFGVGSAISNAPLIDFAMDITAIKKDGVWNSITKRGKFDGIKQLWRCRKSDGSFYDVVTRSDEKPDCEDAEPLLKPLIRGGKIVADFPTIDEEREYVLEQLRYLDINKKPWE
ncbi:MAG: nicotinate phosphoribosyltransferase [Candidatus Njordarchaeia archaeon]